ncbi:cytochrome P450 [Metarhizium robertsii]|uniref:Cytochrome P450 n=1 Tax=Metarhizium robertsii TaxID=568076 RepID=A0A014PGQ5_9HYPO|nr:cytochrome P450 [Metarhizium robertsii]
MALTNTTILLVNAYFIFSYIAIIIRRLYFHPLAGFPGPKFAAATSWYAFYYDAVKGGQFYREMKRMHDKYGPIVRINPKEVHILDASFYDEIYAPASKRRDKYDQWVVFPDVPTGAFATCPHEHRHIRRQALNLSFSKKVIYEIENLLVNKARRLCSRFEKMAQTGEEVRIDAAFFALANDIITQYTFGECYDCLTEDDFRKDFKRILLSAVETGAFVRQFPWLVGLVRRIPFWVLGRISRGFATILNWESIVRRRVETWMATSKTENQTEVTSVFSRLLTSDLPDSEKSFQRLVDEGKSLTGEGSETISWTLTLLIWYVTQDKEILENLRQDLNDMPRGGSRPSLLSWIDKRAYLKVVKDAAVTEALRLNYDALGRLTRVAQEPIQYGDRVIPPGVSAAQR